jgi:hypothetical protein
MPLFLETKSQMMAVMGVFKQLLAIGVPHTKFDLQRGSATFFWGSKGSA